MSDRPNTDTQTTDDVNAILAGMALPQQLQPRYRPDLPPGLLSPSQLPPELRGTVVPQGTFRTAQADPANPPPATPPPATPPTSTSSVTPGGDQPLASPPTPSTPATPPTARSVTPGSNAPMLSPTPPIPALQPPQRPGQWQDRPDVVWQNRPPQPIPQQQHVSDTQQKFIETYGPLAEQAGKALGVDPRLILGQWALESGWGVGPGAAQVGNMAGIKGRDGQYTRYNSPEEFADAYVRFLRDNPRYRGAIGAGTNADQFFGGLKQAGYFGSDLGQYMQGVFRNIGVFGTVAQGQGPTVQPQSSYPPAEPRDSGDWGHPPPMQGQGGRGPDGQPAPGQLPQPSAFGRIMSGLAPLLLAIGSLALRLPLSSAITAYGAMARAQQNGEEQEYQRNRTRWRDQLGEATAQQALESRAASDAFSEYGHNNPQGLQQELMRVALQYNDPTMYQMAERGDLNGIYQMQQKRDALNQDLTKTHKAAEEEADRQAQDNAVKAMDNQWHDKFVKDNGREPTADEAAIAHNEHIGQAGRAGTKASTTGSEQEGQPLDVIGADGKPTGQQVRAGKQGGYFDPSTGQRVQLQPGERTEAPPRERAPAPEKPEQEGEVRNVLGPDGKPTGQQVREGKTGGYYDPDSGERVHLKPGETIQQPGRGSATGAGGAGKPYDIVETETGKKVSGPWELRFDPDGTPHRIDGGDLPFDPNTQHVVPATGAGRAGAQPRFGSIDDLMQKWHEQFVKDNNREPTTEEIANQRKEFTQESKPPPMSSRQVSQRLGIAIGEAAGGVAALTQLSAGATLGPWGGAQAALTTGVYDNFLRSLTNRMTPQQSQMMNSIAKVIARPLASLEAAGVATGLVGVTQSLQQEFPQSGDTGYTVLTKLANIRNIVDAAADMLDRDKNLDPDIKKLIAENRAKVDAAIPYTLGDVVNAQSNPTRENMQGLAERLLHRQPTQGRGQGQGGGGGGWSIKPVTP